MWVRHTRIIHRLGASQAAAIIPRTTPVQQCRPLVGSHDAAITGAFREVNGSLLGEDRDQIARQVLKTP